MITVSDVVGLISLSILLLVLSLDNAVFISLLSSGLREPDRTRTRKKGLMLACGTNIAMLAVVGWVKKLETPLFTVGHFEPTTGRDLVLILGGLVLIGKATSELHDKLEGKQEAHVAGDGLKPGKILGQIAILNLIFSIDSVLTAVGMADQYGVMVASMVTASVGLFVFGEQVGQFVMSHPTLKVLALSFLILIGSNRRSRSAARQSSCISPSLPARARKGIRRCKYPPATASGLPYVAFFCMASR